MTAIGGRAPGGLRLIVDVAQRLPVVIPDDDAASVVLFDVPRRREAALLLYRHVTPSSCKTIFSAVRAFDDEARAIGFLERPGGGKRRSAIESNLLLRADARQARPGS